MLKQIETSIILFWYTLMGFIATLVFIFGEMAIKGSPFRLFGEYTGHQMLICFGAAVFDNLSLVGLTIAFRADKSGFVALLSYLNIVWAYMADILILGEVLNSIEFIAALTILLVAVGTATYKLYQ